MAKTVTLRVDDNVYNMIKHAADGERRTISNYIEWATLNYLTNEIYVSDEEMNDIIQNNPDLKIISKTPKVGTTQSLPEFQIAERKAFSERLKEKIFRDIEDKVRNYVYPQLKLNPFFGANIKKLKGECKDTCRYRIGKFRIFYIIEKEKVLVLMIDIEQRKDSYK